MEEKSELELEEERKQVLISSTSSDLELEPIVMEAFDKLGDEKNLERERGERELKEIMSNPRSKPLVVKMIAKIKSMFESTKWEHLFGALLGTQLIFTYFPSESTSLQDSMVEKCKKLLKHSEFRVRNTIGKVLGSLIKIKGMSVYSEFKETMLEEIETHFIRGEDKAEENLGQEGNIEKYHKAFEEKEEYGKKPGLHDTEGWQNLETSMRTLQDIIEASGLDFIPFLSADDNIFNIVAKASSHLNRFVREIGYFLAASLFSICDLEALKTIAHRIAPIVADGLADNWSQVRFAASTSVRAFYDVALSDPEFSQMYFPMLIPAMCLNRYYIAEGVKLYSLETWKKVVGQKGIEIVIKYTTPIIKFYISQCSADNHAVREAACHCISELCSKIAVINKECMRSHVTEMLDALILCFKDMSWPVRDSACVACGQFVLAFPEESKSKIDELYELWCAHLCENISSVRENSAVALGNAMRAFGEPLKEKVLKLLSDSLLEAKNQSSDSKKFTTLAGSSTYGVAHQAPLESQMMTETFGEADPKHQNQMMYSCGSLAPKLRKGGEVDYGFQKAMEPWEVSDGAIYLLRELSMVEGAGGKATQFMEQLCDLTRLDHFKHSANLKETVFKTLPHIMESMGKRHFKMYLELFIDPLFKNINNSNRNCGVSACECIKRIGNCLGRNIFKGRIEMIDPSYLPIYQQIMDETLEQFSHLPVDSIYHH